MKKTGLIIIAVLSFIFTDGYTQEPGDDLAGYMETASANNPGLKATFNKYMAALEKIPQAGSLPDPQATFGYLIKPMELLGGSQIADIQLMQMFPWFGTLKASKDEAAMMAKAKYEAFNAAKAELFYKVKSGWYKLMKLDREITLVKENMELLVSLEQLVLTRIGAPVSEGSAQSGLQDVLRVRMEILEKENMLALLYDKRRTGEEEFNALLNRDLEAQVQISDSLVKQPLPFDRSAIVDSILNNSPVLEMMENETATYTLTELKAKKMGLPMLGIGLDYMVIKERTGNTSSMNGMDMFMPMVSLSVPIYRKKYSAMMNEAHLMHEAGQEQINELRNNLLVQYRHVVQDLDDSDRRIRLYEEQEVLARQATGLILTDYTNTGNSYEDVIRMHLRVLDYAFKHVEAIADYNTAVAKAELLTSSFKY